MGPETGLVIGLPAAFCNGHDNESQLQNALRFESFRLLFNQATKINWAIGEHCVYVIFGARVCVWRAWWYFDKSLADKFGNKCSLHLAGCHLQASLGHQLAAIST